MGSSYAFQDNGQMGGIRPGGTLFTKDGTGLVVEQLLPLGDSGARISSSNAHGQLKVASDVMLYSDNLNHFGSLPAHPERYGERCFSR